jgi:hypothetical protein
MKLRTVNKALAVLIVVGLIVMAVQSIPEKTTVGRVLQQVIEQGREGDGPSDSWTASTHYSPDENLEGIEFGVLDHAHKSLDIAMFSFTDELIERELEHDAERGVRIRLYRDRGQFKQERQNARERGGVTMTDKLAAEPNVEVKIKAGYELMHENYVTTTNMWCTRLPSRSI